MIQPDNKLFMMSSSITAIFVGLTALTVLPTDAADPSYKYRSECLVWDNVTTTLDREDNVDMTCNKNSQCSGIDCQGDYTLPGPLTMYSDWKTSFCFGIVLEPCDRPVGLNGYIEVFDAMNRTETTTFYLQNDTEKEIQINGTHFPVFSHGTADADAFLEVHMNEAMRHNKKYLFLGVKMKIRIQTTIGGQTFEASPSGTEVAIVRDMYIPVPQCDARVPNHTHTRGTCHFKAAPPAPGKSHSGRVGPGTVCTPGSIDSCGNGQICDEEKCWCTVGFTYNTLEKVCSPQLDNDTLVFDIPAETQGASKNIIIISTCSLAGFFVVAAIVLAVALRYKRQRARYSQHELLLSNEDDDPDVPDES